MDRLRLNGFLTVRGLLDKAEASEDETAPGAISAVVLCDLAVETAAKAALSDLGRPASFPGRGYETPLGELKKPPRRDPRLAIVLDQLLAHMRIRCREDTADMPGIDGARRLRTFRNGVQHDGNVPSRDDVQRSRVRAIDFTDGLLESFYGTRLLEISRASLLQDKAIADLVREAETEAAKHDFSEAGRRLAAGFALARFRFRTGEPWEKRLRARTFDVRRAVNELEANPKIPPSTKGKLEKGLQAFGLSRSEARDVASSLAPTGRSSSRSRFATLFEDLIREVQRLEDRVQAFSAAGDPSEYAWFRRRVPQAQLLSGDDEPQWHAAPPEPPLSQGEYLRALDFVVATALRWQEVPDESEDAALAVETEGEPSAAPEDVPD